MTGSDRKAAATTTFIPERISILTWPFNAINHQELARTFRCFELQTILFHRRKQGRRARWIGDATSSGLWVANYSSLQKINGLQDR